MLELENISFTINGKKILKDINLKLEEGKFYVITGPNGSGKSTLAKIIMGLEKPTTGKIIFNNQDITNKSIEERANLNIGFAFQQPVKFKGITVHDMLKIATKEKLSKNDSCQILSQVGLCAREYVDREINNSLSGGELKRIEIASVLARKPKLAIFDEPEAGIDLWSFNNLTKVFSKIASSSQGITLVISHQERILNIADYIILMKEGTIKKVDEKNKMINTIFSTSTCPKGVDNCD